ncbi:5-oxoprolinase subunit PxpB [Microbulbifer salipaludis]|uniref:5-oxoprolinase subunit PxpB n=1 Tax=Microbulbifer salipaludis TaxID=187980 RepID=A0ABS3E5D8_9GAMM|nr:5-oxoprolinase subunit PxpB [Microbulbifer salipaludis]MBN8430523.1 5-oxoprolinase subunit PxpB [Microbulbifer salipaludis]
MSLDPHFTIAPNGDAALDIRFAAQPGEQLSESIIALAESIESAALPAVTELVPAYQCLTVCFDPLQLPDSGTGRPDTSELEQALAVLARGPAVRQPAPPRERYLIRIPVCYDAAFAPDMQALSAHSGLTPDDIISRHTAPQYLVHMLGFTPGFLYLGGLDTRLHCPRKARPALNVPAGSVGIGGTQTGIYPQATPGGWQIIGRTPLALFQPERDFPFVARPLDRIQFVAISAEEFQHTEPGCAPQKTPLADTEAKQ